MFTNGVRINTFCMGLSGPNHMISPTMLVCKPDVANAHGVEAHHLRRYSIDSRLIGTGKEYILLHREHSARARSIASRCTIHHCKDTTMNLFLDVQQVHQCLMNPAMGIVATSV